ncbi:MAG: hypothetical protein Q9218_003245 [Villophora microphyllina]
MFLREPCYIAIVLLCGFSNAMPNQSIKKREFNLDPTGCRREQDQKDLITTELGVAIDMAKAAADTTLDSNNRWAKYFFDDATLTFPDMIKDYYKKLSAVADDEKYPVSIKCPVKNGPGWEDCKDGETWGITQPYGTKRYITVCPIWFDGYQDKEEKQDSSVVKTNCPKGAKAAGNWVNIDSFRAVKSFTLLHEFTHLNYATGSDDVPEAQNNRSLDYAYERKGCKSLRDGKKQNIQLCKDYDKKICPAALSFRNADTLAFVAAGIYWEKQCDKTIDIEPAPGTTELDSPIYNDDPPEPLDFGYSAAAATATTSAKPKPAKTTSAKAPKKTKASSGTCASGTFSESTCNNECGDGTCKSGVTTLGQLYYFCDCP